MRKIILLLMLIALPFACGKEYPFATEEDCDDCFTEKPEYGPLQIKLDNSISDSAIVVKVYDGKFTDDMKISDDKVIFQDTITESSVDVDVLLDKYYSVVAEYYVNGKIFRVVDGDKIKLYSIENTCDFECWIIRGGEINCKLKF